MTTIDPQPRTTPPSSALNIGLWVAQAFVGLTFTGGGVWKLVTPLADVAEVFPWAGEISSWVLYTSAVFDILGGLGVLLPSLTRIRPQLTVVAASGCVALQAAAILFHLVRGEGADTAINFVFLALAGFVAWGRATRAPVAPRR